jgi:hypothetical protein
MLSLDKAGDFQPVFDPLVLYFVAPYGLIAAVAFWNRARPPVLWAALLATVVVAGIAMPRLWAEKRAWQRVQAHRGVMHMGLLTVLVIEWGGSLTLLTVAVVYRAVAAIQNRPAK